MTTYIETTMVKGLRKICYPNSPANNFVFAFKMKLHNSGVKAHIKEFTNDDHTDLHIQLICEEKYQSDVVDIAMIALNRDFSFKWGYYDPATKTLKEHIPGTEKVLNIDIFNIQDLK